MRTFVFFAFASLAALAAAQDGILERALKSHPKVLAAKAAVEAERAGRSELLSPFRPILSINGYAAGGDGAMVFSSTVDPVNQAMLPSGGVAMGNLMLMWKVWTGGRAATAGSLGDRRVRAASFMLDAVAQDVAQGVFMAVAEARYRHGALSAATSDALAAAAVEKNAKLLEEAGKVPKAFVLRATAEARARDQEVAMAQAALEAAMAQLEEAVGSPVKPEEIAGLPEPQVPASLEAALEAGADRPELAFFREMAEAQGLEADLVRQALRPEVSLVAMGNSFELANGSSGSESKFGLVVSIPLSDGGMRSSRARMLDAKAQELMAQAEAMRLAVRREIQSAWAEWSATAKVTEGAAAGLKAAEESYEVERLRFESGKSTVAELMDSLASLQRARLGVVSAEKFRSDSMAKLARAVGRG